MDWNSSALNWQVMSWPQNVEEKRQEIWRLRKPPIPTLKTWTVSWSLWSTSVVWMWTAEKGIRKLKAQLEKAHHDLVRNDMRKREVESANAEENVRMVCAPKQTTKASQTCERDRSDLIPQLQKAHKVLDEISIKPGRHWGGRSGAAREGQDLKMWKSRRFWE